MRGNETSLAILYFESPGGSEEDEYFRIGVTEDIIIELSRVRGLSIRPISAIRPYRNQTVTAAEIGRALEVSHVLEGSLRRQRGRLTLSVQLVEVASRRTIWGERYDRNVQDIFAIQREVAESIAENLKVVLTEAEKKVLSTPPTTDVKAYDLYLRGRQHFQHFRRRSIEVARETFRKAIEQDPDYAGAYAGLADCHSYLFMFWESDPDYLARADTASRKAVDLAPDLPEARVARGVGLSLGPDRQMANAEFREAIRLDPKHFEAHYFGARDYYAHGELDRAVYWFRNAMEVRPEDFQAPTLLGSALRGLGLKAESDRAYREAVRLIEGHLDVNPGETRSLYFGAIALAQLGERRTQALEWAERALAMDPEEPQVLYNVACFYSLVGMTAKAMDCLKKTIAHGDWWKGWMKNDPDLERLHQHAEFRALVD